MFIKKKRKKELNEIQNTIRHQLIEFKASLSTWPLVAMVTHAVSTLEEELDMSVQQRLVVGVVATEVLQELMG